jgi:protein phosphatase
MTEDHSWIMGLVKSGVVSAEAARAHPDRNLVVRALGLRAEVQIDIWNRPFPVHDGDAFLLCSDGLHDLVEDEEMASATTRAPAAEACAQLIALAKERGGHDNISCGVLRFKSVAATEGAPLNSTRDCIAVPPTSAPLAEEPAEQPA